MIDLYDTRRYATMAFLVIAVAVVALFLYISGRIVSDLAAREREHMEMWADATKAIVNYENDDTAAHAVDMDFLLNVIEGNRTIPVLLTDDRGVIILHRNFDLPEPVDSARPLYISPVNSQFLYDKLEELGATPNVIHIIIAPGLSQHLYYEDSRLLKMLGFYPYVQLVVMILFVLVTYLAVTSSKRAEQNKVWVGLTKETAHQLGTPISSLMAWMQMLESMGVDADTVREMNKDVERLSTVASRFGKVGSEPKLYPVDLNEVVGRAVAYMSTRVSSRVSVIFTKCDRPVPVNLSTSLFEWVMENLIKNAVDAMDADGTVRVTVSVEKHSACIDVTDTGKGIPRKHFKTVFKPGYTTKQRGWGLGLALARRIVRQYHHGRIFVSSSLPCLLYTSDAADE